MQQHQSSHPFNRVHIKTSVENRLPVQLRTYSITYNQAAWYDLRFRVFERQAGVSRSQEPPTRSQEGGIAVVRNICPRLA